MCTCRNVLVGESHSTVKLSDFGMVYGDLMNVIDWFDLLVF